VALGRADGALVSCDACGRRGDSVLILELLDANKLTGARSWTGADSAAGPDFTGACVNAYKGDVRWCQGIAIATGRVDDCSRDQQTGENNYGGKRVFS
jgi:hypothetical protein